jgi:hypothetical protein
MTWYQPSSSYLRTARPPRIIGPKPRPAIGQLRLHSLLDLHKIAQNAECNSEPNLTVTPQKLSYVYVEKLCVLSKTPPCSRVQHRKVTIVRPRSRPAGRKEPRAAPNRRWHAHSRTSGNPPYWLRQFLGSRALPLGQRLRAKFSRCTQALRD